MQSEPEFVPGARPNVPDDEPPPSHPEHHRSIQGGTVRAAVFGISDGLVSNLGLVLGVAGADPVPGAVRLAGVAGLIAGAVSMAAGEYNSMRVQADLMARELRIEERELRRRPNVETVELATLYERRGLPPDGARALAQAVMSDPQVALEAHAREEMGINPHELGRPLGAAVWSLVTFSAGALIPLLPWFFGGGTAAIVASLVLGVVAAVGVGFVIGRSTERGWVVGIGRQLAFTMVPAAITYLIGSALGVDLS